jgi:hypothetical protein
MHYSRMKIPNATHTAISESDVSENSMQWRGGGEFIYYTRYNFLHLYTFVLTPYNPKTAIINYKICIYNEFYTSLITYFHPVSMKGWIMNNACTHMGLYIWGTYSKFQDWILFCTLFLGVKWPWHEANHSPPSSADVNYVFGYISTPPYVFMMWCLVKHRMSSWCNT